MAFWDRIFGSVRRVKAARDLAEDAFIRAERLEIACRALEMRLSALEELHKHLDYTVRGRLGGRPRKEQQPNGAPATPVPLGALHLIPPKE